MGLVLVHKGQEYKIIRPQNPYRGMIGKTFKDFDGTLFHGKGKVWMPYCPPMQLVYIKNGTIIDIIQAEPLKLLKPSTWKEYDSKEPYDFFIEMRCGITFRCGDEVVIR